MRCASPECNNNLTNSQIHFDTTVSKHRYQHDRLTFDFLTKSTPWFTDSVSPTAGQWASKGYGVSFGCGFLVYGADHSTKPRWEELTADISRSLN